MYRINKTFNYSISNLSSSSSTSKLVKRKSKFFNFTNRFSSLLLWKVQPSHHRTTFSPVWVHKLHQITTKIVCENPRQHKQKNCLHFLSSNQSVYLQVIPAFPPPIWFFRKFVCSTQFLWIPKNLQSNKSDLS